MKLSSIILFFVVVLTYIICTNDIAMADAQDLPKNRPHIRIFRNFGTPDEIIRNKYDLSFFPEVSQQDLNHIGLKYELNAYMIVPSEKSSYFKEWWCTQKLHKSLEQCIFPDTWLCGNQITCDIPEDMFLHFKKDTVVTLGLGVDFLYGGSRTGIVSGWDPNNFLDNDGDGFMDIDMDKDGNISDSEWESRPIKNASARRKQDARIPDSYWGKYWEYLTGEPVNHHSNFLMNVGNSEYLEFMSDIYIPGILNNYIYAKGIYFDNSLGSGAKTWIKDSEIVEYDNYEESFYADNFYLLQTIKDTIPTNKIIIGNQWDNARPLDGTQRETWIDITFPYKSTVKSLKSALDLAKLRLSQGLIFLAQYSPSFHAEYAMTGPDIAVSRVRDQLYALASYYLIAGEKSYFGYGNPPYLDDGNLLFEAINIDIGSPLGDYFIFSAQSGNGNNILKNSNFETADDNNNPAEWIAAEPVEIDNTFRFEGSRSVRIDSATDLNNNSNGQSITLKPYTTYTLSGFVRTLNVTGPYPFSGANFYPYDFNDSTPILTGCMGSLSGTNDWTFLYCTFTTGSDVEGNIYYRIMFGSGIAWFDKIELAEGEPKIVLARRYSKALVLVRPRADENAGYEDPVSYKLDKVYRPLLADGTIGKPSNYVTLNSAESAILTCTYWNGGEYVIGADCQNLPPYASKLDSPSNGASELSATVLFKWFQTTDPNGDTVSYKFSYCTNQEFSGCSPIPVTSLSDQNYHYARNGDIPELLLLGIIITGGFKGRKKLTLIMAALFIAGSMTLSCGGEAGSGGSQKAGASFSSGVSYTVSGLSPNTTYYWKVTADDGNGGVTDSATWSFKTK